MDQLYTDLEVEGGIDPFFANYTAEAVKVRVSVESIEHSAKQEIAVYSGVKEQHQSDLKKKGHVVTLYALMGEGTKLVINQDDKDKVKINLWAEQLS